MSKDDGSRTQLVVGVLGFLGVVVTVLATIFAPIVQERLTEGSRPTQTPFIIVATPTQAPTIVPTDTVPAGDPTSTPAPTDTATPAPTLTFTPILPVAIGEDWTKGCVSSLWLLYPFVETSTENGCLQPPLDKFFIKEDKLAFGFTLNVTTAEVHGLFTQLPASGQLTLNVQPNEVVNGEVLIGVFGGPNFDSTGALLVIPASNNPEKSKFLLKSMPGQRLFSQSSGPVDSYDGVYDLFFDFNSGEVTVKLRRGQINLGTLPALSPDKWLFVGYQVFLGSNRLNAEFSNLVIVR